MLVDTGAAVNIMPYLVLRRLGHSVGDLIKTNITLSEFNGQTSEAQGVLSVDLMVGRKTVPTSFFVVNSKGSYTVHNAPVSDSMGWRRSISGPCGRFR
jgi:hypothetical protein